MTGLGLLAVRLPGCWTISSGPVSWVWGQGLKGANHLGRAPRFQAHRRHGARLQAASSGGDEFDEKVEGVAVRLRFMEGVAQDAVVGAFGKAQEVPDAGRVFVG